MNVSWPSAVYSGTKVIRAERLELPYMFINILIVGNSSELADALQNRVFPTHIPIFAILLLVLGGGPSPPCRDRKARHLPGPASFQACQQLVGGVGGLRVVQSAGIKRHRPPEKLHREGSLFVVWQGFESIEKLGCLTTHNTRLPISAPVGKGAPATVIRATLPAVFLPWRALRAGVISYRSGTAAPFALPTGAAWLSRLRAGVSRSHGMLPPVSEAQRG